ncbi:carboxymuconolactone decarboxylase family protein [Kitasatospora sp. NPDC088134]|uniref:carboxymuconolactone decarboxylase family protein n=1 Tax=Kitasatospora sp. NPDC088134 TaxID=3364071 RepID=UPI00382ED4F6
MTTAPAPVAAPVPAPAPAPVSARQQHGAEVMRALGLDPDRMVADLAPLDERFGHTVVEYVFGAFVGAPGLDLRTRELATIAVLVAIGGCEAQLETHLRAALHLGVPRGELVALITHVTAYAGIPRVMNAVAVAKRVLPPA